MPIKDGPLSASRADRLWPSTPSLAISRWFPSSREIVQSGMALVDHLSEYGSHVSFETTISGGNSIGKVLAGWPNSHEIDVIMMSADHHSCPNEIVWGGVTKTVIGQPPCWTMISRQALSPA